MYNQQNGFFPSVTKLLGLAILVYSFFVTLLQVISKILSSNTLIDIVITFVTAVVVLLFPMWLGLFLVKMFPSVRVMPDGIKFVSIGFLKDVIKWSEIEETLLFENGCIAIAFQRRGLFVLNRTYFNKLYGMLIRHESAVLFLSPGTTNRDEILAAIHRNSNVQGLKKVLRRH